MNELDNMRIALKKFFADKGLSQTKIAEMVGTSQQTISGLLSNRNFGKRTAQKWSETFGLNPAWLITGEGEMLLADKQRKATEQPSEPAQQQGSTSKMIVELGVSAVATQILELVQNGELYTKTQVLKLEEKISRQEKTINELNREIGSLRAQLNQCNVPAQKETIKPSNV
ncbi:MAG: helix-turn-helix domain-containing protein [Muribaculaceae bacterium]|nr:helix-turn-helix domain-containing protein [Muribaculaceae bacterium]MCM1532764.1 helix-turn-helix domain-containing protein [Ruminococcus flavefaciens]